MRRDCSELRGWCLGGIKAAVRGVKGVVKKYFGQYLAGRMESLRFDPFVPAGLAIYPG